MGVTNKLRKNYILENSNLSCSSFLKAQGHWGHKKERLNHSFNIHLLGLKSNSAVFNPEHFIEYCKRSSIFCSKTILNRGTIFFINSDDEYRKIVIFFGSRSLQPINCDKWIGGFLTNNFFKNPCVLVTPNLDKNIYILKEASRKLIPVISIEDTDHNLNKPFYSILGNDDSKQSVSYFYNILSDYIIKSSLYNHCKRKSSLYSHSKNINKRK